MPAAATSLAADPRVGLATRPRLRVERWLAERLPSFCTTVPITRCQAKVASETSQATCPPIPMASVAAIELTLGDLGSRALDRIIACLEIVMTLADLVSPMWAVPANLILADPDGPMSVDPANPIWVVLGDPAITSKICRAASPIAVSGKIGA